MRTENNTWTDFIFDLPSTHFHVLEKKGAHIAYTMGCHDIWFIPSHQHCYEGEDDKISPVFHKLYEAYMEMLKNISYNCVSVGKFTIDCERKIHHQPRKTIWQALNSNRSIKFQKLVLFLVSRPLFMILVGWEMSWKKLNTILQLPNPISSNHEQLEAVESIKDGVSLRGYAILTNSSQRSKISISEIRIGTLFFLHRLEQGQGLFSLPCPWDVGDISDVL